MNLRLSAALVAACLTLGACADAPRGDPGRGMPDRVTLAAGGSQAIGQAQARRFIEVVTRIEPEAEAECARRDPAANCDFRIVVDDRPGMPPNAFQTLDSTGRPLLAFTLALIADIRNADEMAFVIAHEASHHIEGHLARQEEFAVMGAAVFGQIATEMAGATPAAIREAQQMGAAVGARRYSKEFELEADALGVVIVAQAGYDPLRGAEFFLRLPDPGSRFMGTHPPNAERIATIRRVAASLGP